LLSQLKLSLSNHRRFTRKNIFTTLEEEIQDISEKRDKIGTGKK
jgi:hypothetical protein